MHHILEDGRTMELMVNIYYRGKMSARIDSGLINMRKIISHEVKVTLRMVVQVLESIEIHMITGGHLYLV